MSGNLTLLPFKLFEICSFLSLFYANVCCIHIEHDHNVYLGHNQNLILDLAIVQGQGSFW